MGKNALDTWLFSHSLPNTLNDGTSISHSADLISSTLVDNIDFCSSVNPASSTHIAASLLFSKLIIESINSFNSSK